MARTAIPFVGQTYDAQPGTIRMSELRRRRADAAADLELRRGDISASMGQQLAGIAGQVANTMGQHAADAPRRRAEMAAAGVATAKDAALRGAIDPATGRINYGTAAREMAQIDPLAAQALWDKADESQRGELLTQKRKVDDLANVAGSLLLTVQKLPPPERQAAYTDARADVIRRGLVTEDALDPIFKLPVLKSMVAQAMEAKDLFSQIESAIKPPDPFTLSEGQTRFDAEGQPIANVPKPAELPKAPDPFTLSPGSVRYGADGKKLASVPPTPSAPREEPFRNPIAVMGPDGESILVDPREAVGKRPASSREQGRAVTSGDAGRIAELDTSLDDLDKLSKQLGTTGAASKVGAMLPNVVTEVTGWGSDAKQRQGTIDRVKQVIGKALEGGVLRKEDEYKYTKILPTIGDPPELAASKLKDLQAALVQRRQRTIEALTDAGYATEAFTQRGAQAPKTQSTPAAPKNPFRK